MYSKIKQFLEMVPKDLTSANEIYNFARNAYKQIMGVFPDGLDNVFLKRGAAEMQDVRQKVVKFPEGGKDKTNPFKTRPGEFGMTILDDTGKPVKTTTGETPESLMEKLVEMTNQNLKDRGLGSIKLGDKIPPPKNKKPAVDPKLQESENLKKEFEDFSTRNMTSVEAMKEASSLIGRKGKYKNISEDDAKKLLEKLDERIKSDMGPMQSGDDPDLFADGGRIGFSSGAGVAGDQMEGDQYVISDIPGSPQVPMGQFGPLNVGIFGGGSYGKNEIIPGVDMATTNQNYGIVGQFPIGNTGFSIGGDYMKSRVNERFTGGNNQVFKSVPTDSDRFNIGINFRKQFKEGSKPPNPGRRNFMKLMAGLASLPVIGKLFKGTKVAEKVVQLKNTTTTMPAWFPQFVEKFISKGVGKKIDQDLMEFTNPDLPNIKVTKADDGRVFVEGQNDYSKNYEIDYTPPGYEVVDEKTGKAVKTKGDFMAQEEVPVNVDPDGNADFDAEVLEDVDQLLTSDARAMEEFATGKKIKEMKSGEFKVGRAEALADAARKGEDFAKGGLAYMLGE